MGNEQNNNRENANAAGKQGEKKHFRHKKNRHFRNRRSNENQDNNQVSATVDQSIESAEMVEPAPATESKISAGRPARVTNNQRPVEMPDMDNILVDDMPALDHSDAVGDELDKIIMAEEASAKFKPEIIPDVIPEGKVVIVGIRFNSGGKTYYFDPQKLQCKVGNFAIVETARGMEFGEVCIAPRLIDESLLVSPLRPVVRIATEEDIRHNKENIQKEDEAFRVCVQKIMAHGLDMKLVKAQYTFDNSKLLFYFTSAGRVDFRELVKDLAGVFHIRIELRQIGIRDEARMLGGLGTCGRPLCCSTFLSDFGQVSMKMAKEQNLSLNSTKISGCCGRLMCCLRYEYDVYSEEIKKSPAIGAIVNTPDGQGVVTEIFPLAEEVKVSLRAENAPVPKRYRRDDVTVIKSKGHIDNALSSDEDIPSED